MKNTLLALCIAACGAFWLPGPAHASSISMDGVFDQDEWAGSFASDDGVGPRGYLGPGYGGQAFDVEHLGLRVEGDTLYFGLQTGFDVQNGAWSGGRHYRPGDFALDVNNDSIFDYALDFSIANGIVTYTLLEVQAWEDVLYPQHGVANPFEYGEGTQVGDTFGGGFGYGLYDSNGDGGLSYVLEGGLDLGLLAMYTVGDPIHLQWTMECGNDTLTTSATAPAPTPEPATLILTGSGLLGLAGLRKRFRARRNRV